MGYPQQVSEEDESNDDAASNGQWATGNGVAVEGEESDESIPLGFLRGELSRQEMAE